MTNFLTILDCIVIFIQPDIQTNITTLRPPDYPTIFIPCPLESFLVSSLLTNQDWEEQEKMDHEQNIGHNRQLYSVWNEKTNMMKIVSEVNPFSSSFFVWLDIGAIRHDGYNHQQMVQKVPQDSGVLLLSVEPFTEEELSLEDEKSVADFSRLVRIGGGTIGCDQTSLERWHTAYYNTMINNLKMGKFMGKDQIMMATTCLETDLCLLVQRGLGDWFMLQPWLRGEINDNYTRLNLINT